MKLRGGNVSEVEVEYRPLSEYPFLMIKGDKMMLKDLSNYI